MSEKQIVEDFCAGHRVVWETSDAGAISDSQSTGWRIVGGLPSPSPAVL